MKKLLCILMMLALCLPMALSLSAAIPEIDPTEKQDITVVMRHDFDDSTEINRNAGQAALTAANGFWAGDNWDCVIENGALKAKHGSGTNNGGYFDLRLQYIHHAPKLAQDIVLSMKIKPTSNDLTCNFVNWGIIGSWEADRVKINNCQIKIDGKNAGSPLTVGEYSLVEMIFHYENGIYTTVDVLVNGTVIGSYNANKNTTRMEAFRCMRGGSGTSEIDEITLALGSTSILYANNTEESYNPDDYAPEIGPSPIPVIPEDEKIGMEMINVVDFNDVTTPNRATSDNAVKQNKGFVALDELDCRIENGELMVDPTKPNGFFDLQLKMLEGYPQRSPKKDVILSMQIKPLSESFSSGDLLAFWNQTQDNMVKGRVSISSCVLRIDKKDVGELPYGVFSLVEFAFRYNSQTGAYDMVEVLLNGKKVGEFVPNKLMSWITNFRIAQEFNGKYAVDNLIFAYGSTSLAYYSPDKEIPEPPVEDTNPNPNPDTNTNPNPNPNTNTQVTTDAATTEAPAPETDAPATTEAQRGKVATIGCFSVVSAGGIGLLVCVMGTALLKKREDLA